MIAVSENEDDPVHGPDDLMRIPIEELALKLVQRVERLQKFKRMNAHQCFIRKEKQLIRIAEVAARARVRELAAFAVRSLEK